MNVSDCDTTNKTSGGWSLQDFYAALLPSLCIVGISGNVLAFLLIQLNFGLRRLPPNAYLSALALTSSLFLSTILFSWTEKTFNVPLYNTSLIGCKILTYIAHVCDFVSIWLMLCVCCDRVVVLWRWRSRELASLFTARLLLFTLLSIGALWSLWALILPTVVPSRGCTITLAYFKVYTYFHSADTLLCIGIPVVLICVVNTALLFKFNSYRRSQPVRASVRFSICSETPQNHPGRGAEPAIRPAELHLSRTILIVTSSFLALNLPSYILRLHMTLYPLEGPPSTLRKHLHLAVYTLYYSHHALLFYIYIFCSPQMRRGLKPTVWKLLECYCLKPVPDFGYQPASSIRISSVPRRLRRSTDQRAFSV